MMPRPKIALTLLLAATALAAAACSSGSSATASTAATSSSPSAVPATIPEGTVLRVADQLGAFETQLAVAGENKNFPYTVDYSSFLGGPTMLQAFQAGSVDIGYVAGTPSIFAQAAHQGIVDIASYAYQNTNYTLTSAPGQSITSWAQVKGKTIGFEEGTVEESAVLQGLQSAGLTLKDITPVNLTATSLVPALEAGKVDAAILIQPLTGEYLAKVPHAVQVPVNNAITNRDAFIIASTAALANPAKAAAIADYVSRLVKSSLWENSHPTAVAQAIWAKEYHLPVAEGEAILTQEGPVTWYDLPGPFLTPQQNLANLYAQAGVIPGQENVGPEFSSQYNAIVDAAVKSAQATQAGS